MSLYKNSVDEKKYIQSMNNLKKFGQRYDSAVSLLLKYKEQENKRIVNRLKKEGLAGVVINSLYARKNKGMRQRAKIDNKSTKNLIPSHSPNYFSVHKIAVYTALFGKYDEILEPITIPDNCDFYIFTDQNVSEDSSWQKVDLSSYNSRIQSLTNAEKNRWFKMFPDALFPDYDYSVYVDASILIISDLTEYVNYLGKYGIGLFSHPCNCIYDECNRCVFFNKITKEQGQKQIEFLKSEGMPENYGLCEGGVIVRTHHSSLCKKIMKEWWEAYYNGPRRDQLSFTYILFKNDIACEDIYLPGNSIGEQLGIKLFQHI